MVYTIEKVLHRYGTSLSLQRGETEESLRGFLQHSGARSWQNMERTFDSLGEIPRGQYVLLAPMEPEIAEGDTLIQGSLEVSVRRIETVMVGDEPAYRWGLCVRKGGEDLWGS